MNILEAIHRIIGCQWGRDIVMPSDMEMCHEQAVRIVALHDGDKSGQFKLCQRHLDLVLEVTDPHKEASDADS